MSGDLEPILKATGRLEERFRSAAERLPTARFRYFFASDQKGMIDRVLDYLKIEGFSWSLFVTPGSESTIFNDASWELAFIEAAKEAQKEIELLATQTGKLMVSNRDLVEGVIGPFWKDDCEFIEESDYIVPWLSVVSRCLWSGASRPYAFCDLNASWRGAKTTPELVGKYKTIGGMFDPPDWYAYQSEDFLTLSAGCLLGLADQLKKLPAGTEEWPARPSGSRPERLSLKNEPHLLWRTFELDLVRRAGEGGAGKTWDKHKSEIVKCGIKSLEEWKGIYDHLRTKAFSSE